MANPRITNLVVSLSATSKLVRFSYTPPAVSGNVSNDWSFYFIGSVGGNPTSDATLQDPALTSPQMTLVSAVSTFDFGGFTISNVVGPVLRAGVYDPSSTATQSFIVSARDYAKFSLTPYVIFGNSTQQFYYVKNPSIVWPVLSALSPTPSFPDAGTCPVVSACPQCPTCQAPSAADVAFFAFAVALVVALVYFAVKYS